MKIRTKLIFSYLLLAIVSLTLMSVLSYFVARRVIAERMLDHLESVASIQHERIEKIIEHNRERLALVSSRTQLRISLEKFLVDPREEYRDKMIRILRDARSSVAGFEDISVMNPEGMVVASTDETGIGLSHPDSLYFLRGSKENSADILFLDENRDLRVRLSGPLYLEGAFLGVIAITARVDDIVSMVSNYSGLGQTGELLLTRMNRNGDALFLTPSRFDGESALRRTVSGTRTKAPAVKALTKEQRLYADLVDYRGEPVFASTRYVETTDWGLAVKIDREEAFAPVVRLRNLLSLLIITSSLIVILISLMLAQSITGGIVRLTRAASRLGEGDLSREVEMKSDDEIGILAGVFNQMTDNLRKSYTELEEKISQRKEAEERAVGQRIVLEAVNRVLRETITCETEEEVAYSCLKVAEDLTGSRFGFICEVNPNGRFDTIAISNPGWDACRMSREKAKEMLTDLEIRGIRGRVIEDQVSMIFNDPSSHPDWIEPPEGHPPIGCFMGVPLRHLGNTIGMIGLGNREGGYRRVDVENIESLSRAFAEALMRKRAEQKVKEQRDALQQINRELSKAQKEVEFYNDLLSHDIRNYINVASGYLQVLLDERVVTIPGELKNSLDVVLKQMKRVTKLVEDVAVLSRIRRLNRSSLQPLDLDEAICATLEWIRSVDVDRTVNTAYNGHRGQYVMGSPVMSTILLNLLDNSVKHNSSTEVRIEIAVEEERHEDRDFWVMRISDNGDGIPDSFKERIFDRYERRSKQSGIGLGLTLVKTAVEWFGGTIGVRDRVQGDHRQGSVFVISFPKIPPPRDA